MTLLTPMVRSTAIGAAMLVGVSASSAQAGYLIDLTQTGSGVIATGSGSIDLTGLTFFLNIGAPTLVYPDGGFILLGPGTGVNHGLDSYSGFTGPTRFGFGQLTFPDSVAGATVGIDASPQTAEDDVPMIIVPHDYVSETPLSDDSIFDGATLASMGAIPGTYVWKWGAGPDQNFTLVVAVAPETSTWAMMILGFAGLAFAGYRAPRKALSRSGVLGGRREN